MAGTDKMIEMGRRATPSFTTLLLTTIPVMTIVHRVNNQLIVNMRNVSACARIVRLTVTYVMGDGIITTTEIFLARGSKVKFIMLVPVSNAVTNSPIPVSSTLKLMTGTEKFVAGSMTKKNAEKSYRSSGVLYCSPETTL